MLDISLMLTNLRSEGFISDRSIMHGYDDWLTCHLDQRRLGNERAAEINRHLLAAIGQRRLERRRARDRKRAARLRRRAETMLRHAGALERDLRPAG